MPEHPDAAQRIRVKLAKAMLPPADVKRVVVVQGTGEACVACDEPIVKTDRLGIVNCVGSTAQLPMHSRCVAIWQYQSASEEE